MTDTELRPWVAGDAPALLRAATSSADLAAQFGGTLPETLDDARRAIAEGLRSDEQARNWAIIRGGEPVGNVGLSAIEFRHGTAWASYWLREDARGSGLAARALASVAQWAFDAGLERLELGHRVNNPASCAVATRAGFAAEGVERAKLRYGNERFDVETHARLASDPPPDVALLALDAAAAPDADVMATAGAPSHRADPPRGALHHLELRVQHLPRAVPSWEWLLQQLGYTPFQEWPDGRSWTRGDTYVVLESAPRPGAHDRRTPGISHVAFHAGSRAEVDRLWAEAPRHGWTRLYADTWPYAGGRDHYAAFLENDERFKVELVAGHEPGIAPTS